jgi:glycerophosphoryl diester phosphodiesterase
MMMISRLYRGALLCCVLAALSISGCKDSPLIPDAINEAVFDLNCPGRTVHFENVDTFLVIGHRGAAALEVENTIPSFQRAINEGANAIELDFVMTKDGQILVWHDWSPDDPIALVRESGAEFGSKYRPRFPGHGNPLRRPADELTLEEFRANYYYANKSLLDKERMPVEIPTFIEFMEWAQNQPKLLYVFFDIKLPEEKSYLADEMIGRMDSIVTAFNPSWRGVYMSPHPSVWRQIGSMIERAGLSFDVDLGSGTVSDDYCSISSSKYARERGHGFATSMHPFSWTERPWTTLKNILYCDLQERDRPRAASEMPVVEKVIAATLNDEAKMRCLVDFGIDGIMTDSPSMLKNIAVEAGKFVQ